MCVATYFNTFLLSFIWRVVFVRFADRGLVVGGQQYTSLLKQIHWLSFFPLAFISIFHFPVQKIISGTYEETIAGSVCTLQGLSLVNEVSRKTTIGSQWYPHMANVFNLYFSYKVAFLEILFGTFIVFIF